MAETRSGEAEHCAGAGFLGADRTGGREIRFQRAGRRHPRAREHNLHLALLWFASWKNGLSSYPPDWVKRDFERFPRAQIQAGKTLELLTPLSDANRDADARAFAALMRHVKEVDGRQHTVIMIQVENEIGMRLDSRDRSPLANKAYKEPVPQQLMDYLQTHKDSLIPEFRAIWEAGGFKTSGTWEEVFGQNAATDEIFMAWNYARYIGRVAQAGKAEYPIPMFLNAALASRTLDEERKGQRTRFSAVGGPMDDLMDVWRAGAPQIDMLSPDAYGNFAEFAARYDRSGIRCSYPRTSEVPSALPECCTLSAAIMRLGSRRWGRSRGRPTPTPL